MIPLNSNFNWNDARRLIQTEHTSSLNPLRDVLIYEESIYPKIFGISTIISIWLIVATFVVDHYAPKWTALPGAVSVIFGAPTICFGIKICYMRHKIQKDEIDPCHPYLRSILNLTIRFFIQDPEIEMHQPSLRTVMTEAEAAPQGLPTIIEENE